jgi:hypothetical protein
VPEDGAPIERALRSTKSVNELRALVLSLIAEGQSQDAILQIFEGARQELRQADREAHEHAVTDVMDLLVGWCSPHMKLPPEQAGSGGRD